MQCGGFCTCIREYEKAKGGQRLIIADMLNDPLHQPGKHKHRRGNLECRKTKKYTIENHKIRIPVVF